MNELQRAIRFRRRLTLAGMALLTLLFATFLLAFHSVKRSEEMNGMVAHTDEAIRETGALRMDRANLRTSAYAFQETHNPAFLSDFHAEKEELEKSVNRLRILTADNPAQQRILDQLAPALAKEMDDLQRTLESDSNRVAGAPGFLASSGSAMSTGDEIAGWIDEFERHETTLFRARSLAVDQSAHRTQNLLLATGALTILILTAAGHLIQREVMKRAKMEAGLRRAQEMLGVRYEGQRAKLDHVVEDLHSQIQARGTAEEELRRLNEALESHVQSRTAELQELNRELEAFTYSVSHDLRAPLRHMDGFSRILQQEFGPQLPQRAQHYLNRVRDASTHMSALVEDLLQLSRVARQNPRWQPVCLQRIVQEAREEILPEAEGRQIEWKLGPLPEVNADPLLLRQVFANLFSNAVKFTRKQPAAVIEVKGREENNKVIISVSDNGAGFDPQYADKLFGVFQRLHRQDEYEGTGIGLATVQRIVHKHGGRVWAESHLGKGATFFFALPASGQALPAAEVTTGATV